MLQSCLPMLLEIVELVGDANQVRQNIYFLAKVHDAYTQRLAWYRALSTPFFTFLVGVPASRGLEMNGPLLSPSRRTAAIFSAASGSMVAMRRWREAESPRLAALCRLARESLDLLSRGFMCAPLATVFTSSVALLYCALELVVRGATTTCNHDDGAKFL